MLFVALAIQIKANRQVSLRVEGDENLLSAFATKLLMVLYKTFLAYCHLVVDSDWHVIPIISLLQDVSSGSMAFLLSLAISTT